MQPRTQTLPPETESTRLQSLNLRAFDAPWPVVMGVCLNGLAGIVTAGPSAPDEEPSQLHGTPASLNGKKVKNDLPSPLNTAITRPEAASAGPHSAHHTTWILVLASAASTDYALI